MTGDHHGRTAGGATLLVPVAKFRNPTRRGDQGLRDCLDAIVSQREALSAGLGPPEGCWRAGRPYLGQTRRVLADPTAALPWHPMVLHRGGWPDGS
jgi:hypothetical protein